MPATLVATPPAAPAPEPEKHTLFQSVALHLLPGLGPILCILLLSPVMKAWGWPPVNALFLGAFLGVLPVQMGILYYLGYKRNGRLSLSGIVLLRERVPAVQLLLLVLGLFVWSAIVFKFLVGWLNAPLLPAFEWMPSIFRITVDDLRGGSFVIALVTSVIAIVGTCWVAPFVEELYFRGFLLPRMPVSGTWAPLVNTVLFSLYHFWSPWENLTRIAAVAPMVYAVHKKRSIWISIATHCTLNTVAMIGTVVLIFG